MNYPHIIKLEKVPKQLLEHIASNKKTFIDEFTFYQTNKDTIEALFGAEILAIYNTKEKKMTKKKATTTKTVRRTIGSQSSNVSCQYRHELIELEAYLLAERSGFTMDQVEAWLTAERLVNNAL